jgi:hypothetical protein
MCHFTEVVSWRFHAKQTFQGRSLRAVFLINLSKGQPVGFYFPSSSGHHSILGTAIEDIPSSTYVVTGSGASFNNSVIQIPGWSASATKR